MNKTNRNTLRDGNAEASAEPRPESLPHGTTKDQIAEMESEGQAQQPGQDVAPETPAQDSREGRLTKKSATEQVPVRASISSPNRRRIGAASPSSRVLAADDMQAGRASSR